MAGRQRIPRPPSAHPGGPPPWVDLRPEERRFTLADVRTACAALPAARPPTPPPGAIPAAVLVPIFEEDGEARVILTKRPDTMSSHRGEIAFPGGKFDDAHDPDLQATALREAHEEVGLDPSLVEVVAEMDTLATAWATFSIAPFIGLLAARPVLVPDATEVVAVVEVAISELLDDAIFREELWDLPEPAGNQPFRDRPIHFFELADETVWGATAAILTRFLRHLTSGPRA